MIEHIHKHIIAELGQNTRTDTIFVLSAILLNLIALAVNSSLTGGSRDKSTLLIVMLIFVALIIVINIVAIFGLMKGKQTRARLINGLLKMYEDKNVSQYYDSQLIGNYNTRYNLFIFLITFTGLISIIIPFIIR